MAFKTIYIRKDSTDKYEALEKKSEFFNWCLNLPCWEIKNKKSLPQLSGIYFVINRKNELLYIGKTENLKKRFSNHHRIEQFKDHKVFLFTTKELELESMFLDSLEPELNFSEYDCLRKTQTRGNKVVYQTYIPEDLFKELLLEAKTRECSVSFILVEAIKEKKVDELDKAMSEF